jgi:hypothetical protein
VNTNSKLASRRLLLSSAQLHQDTGLAEHDTLAVQPVTLAVHVRCWRLCSLLKLAR